MKWFNNNLDIKNMQHPHDGRSIIPYNESQQQELNRATSKNYLKASSYEVEIGVG